MAEPRVRFIDPPGLFASPRYAHIGIANGFAFISGQAAFDEKGDLVGKGALNALGATAADIVKFNNYVVDRRVLPGLVDIRRAVLGDVRAASTTVVVAGLVRSDWLIEVDAIVALPTKD